MVEPSSVFALLSQADDQQDAHKRLSLLCQYVDSFQLNLNAMAFHFCIFLFIRAIQVPNIILADVSPSQRLPFIEIDFISDVFSLPLLDLTLPLPFILSCLMPKSNLIVFTRPTQSLAADTRLTNLFLSCTECFPAPLAISEYRTIIRRSMCPPFLRTFQYLDLDCLRVLFWLPRFTAKIAPAIPVHSNAILLFVSTVCIGCHFSWERSPLMTTPHHGHLRILSDSIDSVRLPLVEQRTSFLLCIANDLSRGKPKSLSSNAVQKSNECDDQQPIFIHFCNMALRIGLELSHVCTAPFELCHTFLSTKGLRERWESHSSLSPHHRGNG
jgi:hypothetical protein